MRAGLLSSISMAAATFVSAFVSGRAHAQPAAAPFPAGKPVSIYVGTAPGGTNDQIMRIVARHIGKYLPGNPTIIPRNMPGAGGRQVASYLTSQAPRDGTEFANFLRGIVLDPMLLDPKLTYRPNDLLWLGSPSGSTDLCMSWHTSRFKTLEDARKQQMIIAAVGAETVRIGLLQKLTGIDLKVVTGYPGGSQANLAVERGEADSRCGASWEAIKSNYPAWIKETPVNILLQFALKRHPELQHVPTIAEFARNDLDRDALKVLLLPQTMGFPFAAPPGLLPEVQAMLREAFDKVWKDAGFLEDAARFQLDVFPISGAELQDLVKDAFTASAEAIQHAKNLVEP